MWNKYKSNKKMKKTLVVMDYVRPDLITVAIYCYLERKIYKVPFSLLSVRSQSFKIK